MRDERLLFREVELQLLAQVLFQPLFDRHGLFPRTDKTEEEVIGVAHVPQSPVVWIVRVLRR